MNRAERSKALVALAFANPLVFRELGEVVRLIEDFHTFRERIAKLATEGLDMSRCEAMLDELAPVLHGAIGSVVESVKWEEKDDE